MEWIKPGRLMSYITIHSTGAVSAIGLSPSVMAAAAMAGISMIKEQDYLSSIGEPYRMALVPDECLSVLDNGVTRQSSYRYRRMLQLLALALEQIDLDRKTPLPVMINLPDNLRIDAQSLQVLQEVHRLSDQPIDWLNSRVYQLGRAGGYSALHDAWSLIDEGQIEQALVIGVDSCACPRTLLQWEKEERLLLSNIGDGFLPGEAAGCLLLKRASERSQVQLGVPAVSQETAHFYNTEEVCLGKGLTAVFEKACEPLRTPVRHVACGLNGESSHIKEWGISVNRLDDSQLDNRASLIHPAESYGDIGAASAPVLIAMVANMLGDNDIEGPVLTWCASDYETRGAVALWKQENR